MRRHPVALALVLTVAAVAVSGVGRAERADAAGKIDVAAAFYPVAFAAQTVGGQRAGVTNLTPVGAEPHDLELTSDDLDLLLEAKVAFLLGGGFQPAIEKAAGQRDGPTVELLPKLVDTRGKKLAGEGKEDGVDRHVWLDPVLMSQLVGEVERGLAHVDKKGAATYQRNADALRAKLADLDARYRQRLTGCARALLVTSHEAFGYLAARYGLEQRGVAGISPDADPDPARLGELAQLARDEGVTTVFTEENL